MKIKSLFKNISVKYCFIIALGCLIQAVGIYNIHSISGVTEGGILGLLLFFEHWLNISPAISSVILNTICYLIGFKFLGKDFIFYSVLSIISFSIFYSILEIFPPIYPQIASYPLIAAILGGIFIGVGAGLTVKFGAASAGDDAIAMTVSKKFGVKIQYVYLISDLVVMAISLSYIPFKKIIYSLLTVLISGQIIGLIVNEKEDKTTDNDKDKKIENTDNIDNIENIDNTESIENIDKKTNENSSNNDDKSAENNDNNKAKQNESQS